MFGKLAISLACAAVHVVVAGAIYLARTPARPAKPDVVERDSVDAGASGRETTQKCATTQLTLMLADASPDLVRELATRRVYLEQRGAPNGVTGKTPWYTRLLRQSGTSTAGCVDASKSSTHDAAEQECYSSPGTVMEVTMSATSGLSVASTAAYIALLYFQGNPDAPLPEDLCSLLPANDAVLRRGHPYIDTMAFLTVPRLMNIAVSRATHAASRLGATVIVAFETRAMAFAAAIAAAMNISFVSARSVENAHGFHVAECNVDEAASYRKDTRIAIDHSSLLPGARVVIVDDIMSSGGTLTALCNLVHHYTETTVVGCVVVFSLTPQREIVLLDSDVSSDTRHTRVANATGGCMRRTESKAARDKASVPIQVLYDLLV